MVAVAAGNTVRHWRDLRSVTSVTFCVMHPICFVVDLIVAERAQWWVIVNNFPQGSEEYVQSKHRSVLLLCMLYVQCRASAHFSDIYHHLRQRLRALDSLSVLYRPLKNPNTHTPSKTYSLNAPLSSLVT